MNNSSIPVATVVVTRAARAAMNAPEPSGKSKLLMKYLIVGLGNIGNEYDNTRHNIGFTILDASAKSINISFNDKRYGFVAEMKHASRTLILLKPNTFVNLSGRSVHYWMQKGRFLLKMF